MTDLAKTNPTGRFSGLSDLYAKHRPDYPAGALDHVISRCGLTPGAAVADVGCGTGISSRLFAARGLRVVGIEPNADMRAKAQAEPVPEGVPAPVYRSGQAEATGLTDGSVAAVVAAQAFHWFDAPTALREFHRVLAPGGWVVLLLNLRDESDPFTAAYGDVIRSAPDAASVEGPRARAGKALLDCELFEPRERTTFPHGQEHDEAGLLGRAFSHSYAPREPALVEKFTADLRAVFARFQRDGRVVVRYETIVYLGRRKG
jgi:SAM-dependent methyltransferase